MKSAPIASILTLALAAAPLSYSLFLPERAVAQEPDIPQAAVKYSITPDKIADVEITEEAPGRFVAMIKLVEAQKKALSESTAAHVGEKIEVSIAGERVFHSEIRGAMDTITIGPWMNEGLVKIFARCLTRCGAKNCL